MNTEKCVYIKRTFFRKSNFKYLQVFFRMVFIVFVSWRGGGGGRSIAEFSEFNYNSLLLVLFFPQHFKANTALFKSEPLLNQRQFFNL